MNVTMPELQPFPLTQGRLEDFRVRTLRRARSSLMGSHLTRLRGHSLEFREHAPYVPGDDVRHIDWLASARYQGEDDLLVRRFQAEEQFTIVVSIDCRSTMWLPDAIPKLQAAFWLAEAIVWAATKTSDRAFLHDLFGRDTRSILGMRGKVQLARLRSALRLLSEQTDGSRETLNLQVLDRVLHPAAIWIIITDFYFADQESENFLGETARELARAIARARDGLRWVILVDLDSWPHERALLKEGGFYIDEPGSSRADTPYEINDATLSEVEKGIGPYKERLIQRSRLPAEDVTRWHWPVTGDAEHFFAQQFFGDAVLARLLERSL